MTSSNASDESSIHGWMSPSDGSKWPSKGPAIAAWMVTGIEAWRRIDGRYDGRGAAGSHGEADQATLHPDARPGEVGQTALLTMGGATELLRGLAGLYHVHPTFPLTRAHLPVFRSLQEHCGRVIWLLEPGTEIGPSAGMIPDDTSFSKSTEAFFQRVSRLKILNEELLDDRLAAAKKHGDTQQEQQAVADGALTSSARKRSRAAEGDTFPGYTGFAEICESTMQQLHLQPPQRTRTPYGRVSETSHGGLLGLLSDSESTSGGRRSFTSDEQDLEAVAARAGLWWQTAIAMCCGYLGWEWEPDFKPFDAAMEALFY